MCLRYKNDLILEHLSPKAINAQDMPVILLENSIRTKPKN